MGTEKCNPGPLLLLRLTEIEKELQASFRKKYICSLITQILVHSENLLKA